MPTAAEEPAVEAKDAKGGADVDDHPGSRRPARRPGRSRPPPTRSSAGSRTSGSSPARSTARPTSGTRAASEDERIGQLLLLHGKDQEPIGELQAGEIGAVAKLAVTETGDTLSVREKADRPAAARRSRSRRCRSRSSPRRRPTSTRWARRSSGCSRRSRRPGSSDRRPASSSSSRSARPTSRSSASGSSGSSARRS